MKKQELRIPFFPYQVVRELGVASFVLGVLLLLAAYFPAPLGEEAKVGEITAIEPQWYLSPLFGFLAFWDSNISPNQSMAVALPVVILLVILLLPFIDRGEEEAEHPLKRRAWSIAGIAFVLLLLYLAYYAYTADITSYAELLT
jgi:quinol-cytochrome oxidoreductase complex cytochrome b subunit